MIDPIQYYNNLYGVECSFCNSSLMGQIISYSSLKGNIVANICGCLINMTFRGEIFVNDNTKQFVGIHIFQHSCLVTSPHGVADNS